MGCQNHQPDKRLIKARAMNIRRTVGFGLLALPFIGGTALILAMVVHNEQYVQIVLVLGAVAVVSAIIFAGAYLVTHDQP